MARLSRRTFLAGTAALATGSWMGWSSFRALGANNRIRVAVMGSRVRGRCHVSALLKQPNVEIAAICDVDPAEAATAAERIERRTQKKPPVVADIRKLLDDPSIDAIAIAAPNHWHSLAAVWACQAGKDVYVEKPISQTVVEGRRLVDAAARYGRIVQHGTQNRSNASVREAIAFLRAGKLGEIKLARAVNYKRRAGIGRHTTPGKVPTGLDYDLWLGPAAKTELARNQLHYDWHWFWETGSGDIGNQGVHQIDLALWGLDKRELPKSVASFGGRLGYDDDGQTPNTQVASFEFDDCRLICEVRNLPSSPLTAGGGSVQTGNIFYGSRGVLVRDLKDNLCRAYLGSGEPPIVFGTGAKVDMDTLDQDHFANFLAAMRSRKPEDLRSDALSGHVASSLCHLANISHRTGQDLPFGERPPMVQKDSELADAFDRTMAHLTDNGVGPEGVRYRLGRPLVIDRQRETLGDPQADLLLTRQYRAGFELPQIDG
jgi:predicted dehydrogenase